MGSAGGLLLSAEPVNVPPGAPHLVPGDIFSVAGQTQLGVWGEYSFATECFLPLGSRSLPYYTLTAIHSEDSGLAPGIHKRRNAVFVSLSHSPACCSCLSTSQHTRGGGSSGFSISSEATTG